jgi:hypothetical protein
MISREMAFHPSLFYMLSRLHGNFSLFLRVFYRKLLVKEQYLYILQEDWDENQN